MIHSFTRRKAPLPKTFLPSGVGLCDQRQTVPKWTGVFSREAAGQATKVIQSYARPAGRNVSVEGAPLSLLQLSK